MDLFSHILRLSQSQCLRVGNVGNTDDPIRRIYGDSATTHNVFLNERRYSALPPLTNIGEVNRLFENVIEIKKIARYTYCFIRPIPLGKSICNLVISNLIWVPLILLSLHGSE